MLAVSLDELTLSRLRAAVKDTELVISAISRDELVVVAPMVGGPTIVLLEWTDENKNEQLELCRALRQLDVRGHCRLIALGGVSDATLGEATLAAAGGAVDDVLGRPFGGDLTFRLRSLMRRTTPPPATDEVRKALEEALDDPKGGEVVVRSGEVTASIHVQEGRVVWADVSSTPASMGEVVGHAGVELDRDLSDAVREECRATGRHFMDVLIEWQVIDEAGAREAVRAFVAGRVESALVLSAAKALFLPRSRPYSGRLSLDADQIPALLPAPVSQPTLIDAAPPSSLRAPPLAMDEMVDVVRAALRIEGARAASVVDRKSGSSYINDGEEIDAAVVWSHLATLDSLGARGEDVVGVTGKNCFMVRPLRRATSLVLFVAFSLEQTTLGMARAEVAQLAAGYPPKRASTG